MALFLPARWLFIYSVCLERWKVGVFSSAMDLCLLPLDKTLPTPKWLTSHWKLLLKRFMFLFLCFSGIFLINSSLFTADWKCTRRHGNRQSGSPHRYRADVRGRATDRDRRRRGLGSQVPARGAQGPDAGAFCLRWSAFNLHSGSDRSMRNGGDPRMVNKGLTSESVAPPGVEASAPWPMVRTGSPGPRELSLWWCMWKMAMFGDALE